MTTENIVKKFYEAFSNLDAEGMVSLYSDDIIFQDPAFGKLEGERAKNMWRMLCESQKGQDFKVKYSQVFCDQTRGAAHWEAFYTFSRTGRKVHNIIEAKFDIKDGKIIRHIDTFNLHRWAKQAMGFSGFLLGWSGFFKNKLQAQTNKLLTKYEAKQSS